MKKLIIFILAMIVLLLLGHLFIEFFYQGHIIENDQALISVTQIGQKKQEDQTLLAMTHNNKAVYGSAPSIPEIMERPPSGVSMQSLKDSKLPLEIKKKFERELELLKRTGSMSGGVLTHEFSRLDEMRQALEDKNLDQQKASLAIHPTTLVEILGGDYKLIGANTQSKHIPYKGWTGFFQIAEKQFTPIMVELSERQIEPQAGDGAQGISDFINDQVNGQPATVEVIKLDKSGYVYNIDWSFGNRLFTLTTKNLSRQESLTIAERITSQFQSFPNEGWKKPYVIDAENNILHRLYQLK